MSARLVIVSGYDKEKFLNLDKAGSYSIGRGGADRNVDLKLDPRECLTSRLHFYIDYRPPRFFIRDNNSTNGTIIKRNNDTIVLRNDGTELLPKDRIIAGNTEFLLKTYEMSVKNNANQIYTNDAAIPDPETNASNSEGIGIASAPSAPSAPLNEVTQDKPTSQTLGTPASNALCRIDRPIENKSIVSEQIEQFNSDKTKKSKTGKPTIPEISLDFFQKADIHCVSCNRPIDVEMTLSEVESYASPLFMCNSCSADSTTENNLKNLDAYRVLRKIGEGGMGTVYLARHNASGMLVTVKAIIPAISASEDDILHFRRDISIVQSLNHPNIAKMYEYSIYRERHYYICEYLPDGNLNSIIENSGSRPMDWKKGCEIICDVLAGLQCCHDKGINHLGIKPSNILFKKDMKGAYSLRLTDSGLSEIYENTGFKNLVRLNQFENTNRYTAPELSGNYRAAMPQTDIYSTGILLFFLLTSSGPDSKSSCGEGQPSAFLGNRGSESMFFQNNPIQLTERNSFIPAQLFEIIDKAIRKNPKDRFQTAQSMYYAIANLLKESES